MPGPKVHLRLTREWAIDEGMTPEDAEVVATADLKVDAIWPGSRKWWRHFDPTASLVFGPLYARRALRGIAEAAGGADPPPDADCPPGADARADALVALGRALHSYQDGIGHGALSLSHLRWDLGLLKRNPDDWDRMPARIQASIERKTRRLLRRFLERARSAEA